MRISEYCHSSPPPIFNHNLDAGNDILGCFGRICQTSYLLLSSVCSLVVYESKNFCLSVNMVYILFLSITCTLHDVCNFQFVHLLSKEMPPTTLVQDWDNFAKHQAI